MKRLLLASFAAGLWLLAIGAPAGHPVFAATIQGACDYDGSDHGPLISGSLGGGVLTLSGSGWQSGEDVAVTLVDADLRVVSWDNGPNVITADDSGRFAYSGDAPSDSVARVEFTGTVTLASCGINFSGSNSD